MGHLILIFALIAFILFMTQKCSLSCLSSNENLCVEGGCVDKNCPLKYKKQENNGLLYGCDPTNPYLPFGGDECNYQYKQNSLIGCGIP